MENIDLGGKKYKTKKKDVETGQQNTKTTSKTPIKRVKRKRKQKQDTTKRNGHK